MGDLRETEQLAVQTEGTACAKGLGQAGAWHIGREVRRPPVADQSDKGQRRRRWGMEGMGQVVQGLLVCRKDLSFYPEGCGWGRGNT